MIMVVSIFGVQRYKKYIKTKKPWVISDSGLPKNRSYLLSHLVGQYHRRW